MQVIEGRFEEWVRPVGNRFDLVFAATAWHWLDPAVRYVKAWDALRPGGHLAFWDATHVFPDGGDPFFFDTSTATTRSARGERPSRVGPGPGSWANEVPK
ncbi:MAG: class I SAM-dependent methyltransferase [Actinomycetota bacterium]|nr:class I SAM-dependent methyltransferase [Actinomycetota bacterium]